MFHILIRVDANAEIATGHLFRAIDLISAIKTRGFAVSLLTTSIPEVARHTLKKLGVKVVEMNVVAGSVADARLTIDLCHDLGVSHVIADGYQYKECWQRLLTRSGIRLVVISNDTGEAYNAALVIDQNLTCRSDKFLNQGGEVVSGHNYCIVPQVFTNFDRHKYRVSADIKSAILYYGGYDSAGETERILKALCSLSNYRGLQITVLCGLNKKTEQIKEIQSTYSDWDITLLPHQPNVAELFASYDLSFGAGGTTSFQRLFLGMPSIVSTVAHNQAEFNAELEQLNLAIHLGLTEKIGLENLSRKIEESLNMLTFDRRQTMFNRGRAYIDGHGADRILNKLLQL